MTALWITLAVIAGLLLLILCLLLFGKARIRITCKERLRVVASVLGIPFTLVSDKKTKEEATKDLSNCRNPNRALKKELRRQQKLAEEARKKAEKKKAKALEKAEKKKQKKELASTQPAPNLSENLEMVTALLKKLYQVSNGRIKLHIRKLHLYIGTGDASKTAILYGAISPCVVFLIEWIEKHYLRLRREKGDVQIFTDYLSQKPHADIDITASIGLMRAARIGLSMLSSYKSEKKNAMKKAKKRVETQQQASQEEVPQD